MVLLFILLVLVITFTYVRGQGAPWPSPPSPPIDLTLPFDMRPASTLGLDDGKFHLAKLLEGLDPQLYDVYNEGRELHHEDPFNEPDYFVWTSLTQFSQENPELFELWHLAATSPNWSPAASIQSGTVCKSTMGAIAKHQIGVRTLAGRHDEAKQLLLDTLSIARRLNQSMNTDRGWDQNKESNQHYAERLGHHLIDCLKPPLLDTFSNEELTQLQNQFQTAANERASITNLLRHAFISSKLAIQEQFNAPYLEINDIKLPMNLVRLFGGPERSIENVGTIYQWLIAELPQKTGSETDEFQRDVYRDPHLFLREDPVARKHVRSELPDIRLIKSQMKRTRQTFMAGAQLIAAERDRRTRNKTLTSPRTLVPTKGGNE